MSLKHSFSFFFTEWVFIGNNLFSDTLPTQLGLLTNLEYFYAEGNQFTGTIPSEMGQMTEMREIDFHDTMLTGTVPEELYAGMADLINMFDFTSANLEGTISTLVGKLHTMDWFLYGENNFSGTLPEEVGKMESVNRFQVHGNNLTGSIPMGLCLIRGTNTLRDLTADCQQISTGETPVFCPSGCCTECCNQDTKICLPASN